MILKRNEIFKKCLNWCARYLVEDKELLKPRVWELKEEFQDFLKEVCQKDKEINRCDKNNFKECEERLERGLKRLGINIKNKKIQDLHYGIYFLILDYKREIAYQYIPSIENEILKSSLTQESSRRVKLPFGEGVAGYLINKWRQRRLREGKPFYSIHFDARQEFPIEDRLQLIDSIFYYPLYFKDYDINNNEIEHLFGVILFTSFFRGVFDNYNKIKNLIDSTIDKINEIISFSIIPSLAQDLDALQIKIDKIDLEGTNENSLKKYMEKIIPILMESEVLDLCGITFESKGKLLACGFSSAVLVERIKKEGVEKLINSLSLEPQDLSFSIYDDKNPEYILSFYFDKNQDLKLESLKNEIENIIKNISKKENENLNKQTSNNMKLYSSFDIKHLINKKIEEFLCDIINYIHPLPSFELKQYWEEFFAEAKKDTDKKNDKDTNLFKNLVKDKWKTTFNFSQLDQLCLSKQTILITLTKNKRKMRFEKAWCQEEYKKLFQGLNEHYHENLATKIHQELLKAQNKEERDQIGLLPSIFLDLEGYSYFWKDEKEFNELLKNIKSIVFLFGKKNGDEIKFEWISSFNKVSKDSYNYLLSLYFEKIEEKDLNSFSYSIKESNLNSNNIEIKVNNKTPIIIALYQLEQKSSIIYAGINYDKFIEKLKDNKITLENLIGKLYQEEIELKINNSETWGKLTFCSTYDTNLKTKRFSDFKEYLKNSLEDKYKLKMEEEKREKYAKGSAFMSILIESYAHNISAHGLEGLRVYLNKQWEDIKKCLKLNEEDKEKFINSLLKALKKDDENLMKNIEKVIKTHSNFSEYLWYLQGKSAFWSAIARGGALFGGKVITMLQLINDFAKNNLLCGSLGASEGFNGIEFYVKLNNGEPVKLYESTIEDFKDFNQLKLELEKINIFMPEGVVGQQAVYTIWENIIRNVKHCKKNDKDLIPFYIEIKDKDENKDYIEIACWLDLDSKGENEPKLREKVNEMNNWVGILDKDQKPNMGGTSQNILCAGMVFGLNYIKTEELQKTDNKVMRFELNNMGDKKIIKFIFKIWKGKEIGKYGDIAGKEIGPLGRFKIIQLKNEEEKKDFLKNPFFLRHVIYNNDADLKTLYPKWIEEWFELKSKEVAIKIQEKRGYFENLNRKLGNISSYTISSYTYYLYHRDSNSKIKSKIGIAYKDDDVIGKIIYGIGTYSSQEEEKIFISELFEILETSMEIFDNRLYKLATEISSNPSLNDLKVKVFLEEKEKIPNDGESKIDFGIFHLSFVERITGEKNEKAIKKFFDNNYYQYLQKRYKIIIITTGRGRDWWFGLDDTLKRKIKFIPIENLESCFDKTLAPKTPSIGVKYALVKTIFGS